MTTYQSTCVTCRLTFSDSDAQREHNKTEWHRYNLKRKVEELPPVSLEIFNAEKLALQTALKSESQKNSDADYCDCCKKAFRTAKTFTHHLSSKKHLDNLAKFGEKDQVVASTRPVEEADEEMEEVDSDEWEEYEGDPVPITECLFCPHETSSLEKSIEHMHRYHTFIIPDLEYLVDVEGLLMYLGAKVGQGNMCLWCNEKGKRFHDLSSVRKHMLDKGHCKMFHEGGALIEYEEYYDFSSSYPEGERRQDEPVELTRLDDSGYELALPSGAKLGHRSLFRYYKQKLNPEKAVAIRGGGPSSSTNRVLSQYKFMGWRAGLTVSEAKKKAKDLSYMRRLDQRHYMKLGWKANKLQKHRRDPTIVFG